MGDRDQLERVLVNLISNAVKYTPDGGEISIAASKAADTVVLTVHDTGDGIAAADQAHLFEPFFRAEAAQRSTVQGTGLGLAIVRSIVSAHEGEAELVSVPGEGTTVTVQLPLAAAEGVSRTEDLVTVGTAT
jgi:two-component system phosphate regulon sensor histidine kinase PhoR